MPKIYSRNCDFCGAYYKKAARRFCSLKCSQEYSSKHPNSGCFKKGHHLTPTKPPVFKTCPSCNKVFEVSKKNPSTKYCCRICSVNHSLKGKKLTKEHKDKISKNNAKYWSSHKMSKDHIEKCIIGLKPYQNGEGHWNWKGGITPLLLKMRSLPRYKEWRKDVFERDNYTCQICGQVSGRLQADHVIPYAKLVYEKKWKELWDIDNGRTLCEKCHRKVDTYAKRFIKKS